MNVHVKGGYLASLADGRMYLVAPGTEGKVERVTNVTPRKLEVTVTGLPVGEQTPKDATVLVSVTFEELVGG